MIFDQKTAARKIMHSYPSTFHAVHVVGIILGNLDWLPHDTAVQYIQCNKEFGE